MKQIAEIERDVVEFDTNYPAKLRVYRNGHISISQDGAEVYLPLKTMSEMLGEANKAYLVDKEMERFSKPQ